MCEYVCACVCVCVFGKCKLLYYFKIYDNTLIETTYDVIKNSWRKINYQYIEQMAVYIYIYI